MGGGSVNYIHNTYNKIISLENLLYAWKEFKRGKMKKLDVMQFEFFLEDNLFNLYQELEEKSYIPGQYTSFFVADPKLRHIHKAKVRDRIVHQALFRVLYQIFDPLFIHNSYSCRFNKGIHIGVKHLEQFARKASANYKITIYALKCDIKNFFYNINHIILLQLIREKMNDQNTLWLIEKIVKSFETAPNKGLPLGNVTSQLFANIYLNKLDQFVKHVLKEKYYIRYCDDFIILNKDKNYLLDIISPINDLLVNRLHLNLHSDKIVIRKLNQGIDFLGYVVLPHYKVLRTKTKKRVLRKIKFRKKQLELGLITNKTFNQSLQSYLGILKHCRGNKISDKINVIIK